MLPEIGASEILLIAVVALIVVGPKDLPVLLRRLGQFMAKLRGMAAEFRASFDEMARQSELDELRKEVEAMRKGQFLDMATQTEDVDAHLRSTIGEIEQSLADVGVQLHPPMGYPYDEATAPPATVAISDAAPEGTVQVPKAKAPRKPRAPKAAAEPKPKPATVEGGSRRKKPIVEGGQ